MEQRTFRNGFLNLKGHSNIMILGLIDVEYSDVDVFCEASKLRKTILL